MSAVASVCQELGLAVAELVDGAAVRVRQTQRHRIEHDDGVERRVEDALVAQRLPERAGVRDRRRGTRRKGFREGQVVGRVAPPGFGPDEGHRAEDLAARDDRDAHVRLESERPEELEMISILRRGIDHLRRHVRHHVGLTGPQDELEPSR